MFFNIHKSKVWLATLTFMLAMVGLICVSAPAYADTPIVRCPAKGFDFNTATSTELQQLSGIGAATATNIINARPFSSIDDLTRVSGIAATTLANYKNQCNVSTDVTLQYWPGQVSVVTAANYYSDQICDLTPVTRDGYIFLNWTYVDGSSSSADIATNCTTVAAAETQSFVFAGSHMIYANWQAAQYLVNFETSGGDVLPDMQVTFGETYGTLPIPIKSGYDFVGWYLDANFTTSVDANTIVATPNDHTLYAKWTEIVTPPDTDQTQTTEPNNTTTSSESSAVTATNLSQNTTNGLTNFNIKAPSTGFRPVFNIGSSETSAKETNAPKKLWLSRLILSSMSTLILVSLLIGMNLRFKTASKN